jgi:hypothetical protein
MVGSLDFDKTQAAGCGRMIHSGKVAQVWDINAGIQAGL